MMHVSHVLAGARPVPWVKPRPIFGQLARTYSTNLGTTASLDGASGLGCDVNARAAIEGRLAERILHRGSSP